ncbi:hypothetical protein FRB96_005717 [Tulasnella sp. 330]|nr:hypothetical protein FRB96_005717 [Tulasnella sp. 330]KAG8880499.1 hypothetical protein FRB97_000734 [Tulasnella sp. 331]KAG8886913.1 hypothetical protein FRB98_000788 [Tulasnella sp. 332]
MGSCISSGGDSAELQANKEVEKHMKETRHHMAQQVKVLLLGSGDSGKSTVLKQMKLIHNVAFTPQEMEYFRQLVFSNIVLGMRAILDAAEEWELDINDDNEKYMPMFDDSPDDIRDGDPLPQRWLEPLKSLWDDPAVQKARSRGNEAALPENLPYFYKSLDRFFTPDYVPNVQDIIRTRARTTGITETVFKLKNHDMHMLDVGGQKSERRKWIHCFSDVTTILFLVSLSGYDQCLIEDKDANQMQDAMAIWDSICHSQWFKSTSIILFLNKTDLFEQKIKTSNIRTFFPDYEGDQGDAKAGKDYFKRRFLKLSAKSNRQKEREIYTQCV